MSDERRTIAAIRLARRPDVLFVDVATTDVDLGDRIAVETASGRINGRIVIAPGQFVGDFSVIESALAGSLGRLGDELVVALDEDHMPRVVRQIGATAGGEAPNGDDSSLDDLFREFESSTARLGRKIDTDGGPGVVVGLDRERGVAVVELETGETLEVGIQAHR